MERLSAGEGILYVEAVGHRVGGDLVVVIGGGTHPHVGAVAVAQPRPSLQGGGKISSSASVITLLGHKEDELARWAALLLAAELNTNVVVTAGLHVDHATPEQIRQLESTARTLVKSLVERFRVTE